MAAVGQIVRAAIAPGPARASRDGLARCCVASGNAVGIELLVIDVVFVELLLLRGEIAKSVVLLGDGGSLCCLGFLGAAAFGRILRIALELDGLLLAVLGGCLRPVEAKEESLLAAKRLPGRRAARLLPRGPACRLRFRHTAVDPGPTTGIPASREGTEVIQDLRPLGALHPCFFSADVALANAPAAPSSPPFVRRDGLMKVGVVGAMMLFT